MVENECMELEFNTIKEENKTLQSKIDEVNAEITVMQDDFDNLQKENSNYKKLMNILGKGMLFSCMYFNFFFCNRHDIGVEENVLKRVLSEFSYNSWVKSASIEKTSKNAIKNYSPNNQSW